MLFVFLKCMPSYFIELTRNSTQIVAVVCDAVAVVDRDAKEEERALAGELTDKQKLTAAQRRIYEVNREVDTVRRRQQQLQLTVSILAKDIRILHAGPPRPAASPFNAIINSFHNSAEVEASESDFASPGVPLRLSRHAAHGGEEDDQHLEAANDDDSIDAASLMSAHSL